MVFTLWRCLPLYLLPRTKWWAQRGGRRSPRLLCRPRGFCTPLPTQAAILRHYVSNNTFIVFFQRTQQGKNLNGKFFSSSLYSRIPSFLPSLPLSPSLPHSLPFFLSPSLLVFPPLFAKIGEGNRSTWKTPYEQMDFKHSEVWGSRFFSVND